MPPQFEQAGPRSRPTILAGITGGVSVSADAAGWTSPGFSGATDGAGALAAGGVTLVPPLPPFVGRDEPPLEPETSSSPVLRARTAGVRMPSSSCVSASRNRDASQRMM